MQTQRVEPSTALREQFAAVFGNQEAPTGDAQATLPENTPDPETTATTDTPITTEEDEDFLKSDPNDSQEIAELKKNLISGFHRANSKRTQKIKELESASASAAEKAKAFDVLMNSANPAELLSSLTGKGKATEASRAPTSSLPSFDYQLSPEVTGAFEPEVADAVKKMFHEMVTQFWQRGIEPSLSPYKGMVDRYGMSEYEKAWVDISKEYPSAAKYREDAEKYMQQGLPIRKALLLASDGAIERDKMKSDAEKVRSKSLTTQTAPVSMTRMSVRGKPDREAAIRIVADAAKRSGITFNNGY